MVDPLRHYISQGVAQAMPQYQPQVVGRFNTFIAPQFGLDPDVVNFPKPTTDKPPTPGQSGDQNPIIDGSGGTGQAPDTPAPGSKDFTESIDASNQRAKDNPIAAAIVMAVASALGMAVPSIGLFNLVRGVLANVPGNRTNNPMSINNIGNLVTSIVNAVRGNPQAAANAGVSGSSTNGTADGGQGAGGTSAGVGGGAGGDAAGGGPGGPSSSDAAAAAAAAAGASGGETASGSVGPSGLSAGVGTTSGTAGSNAGSAPSAAPSAAPSSAPSSNTGGIGIGLDTNPSNMSDEGPSGANNNAPDTAPSAPANSPSDDVGPSDGTNGTSAVSDAGTAGDASGTGGAASADASAGAAAGAGAAGNGDAGTSASVRTGGLVIEKFLEALKGAQPLRGAEEYRPPGMPVGPMHRGYYQEQHYPTDIYERPMPPPGRGYVDPNADQWPANYPRPQQPPQLRTGGPVAFEQGGPTMDNQDGQFQGIPATLHEDEYVIRPEAVQVVGQPALDALNTLGQPGTDPRDAALQIITGVLGAVMGQHGMMGDQDDMSGMGDNPTEEGGETDFQAAGQPPAPPSPSPQQQGGVPAVQRSNYLPPSQPMGGGELRQGGPDDSGPDNTPFPYRAGGPVQSISAPVIPASNGMGANAQSRGLTGGPLSAYQPSAGPSGLNGTASPKNDTQAFRKGGKVQAPPPRQRRATPAKERHALMNIFPVGAKRSQRFAP